MMIVRRFVTVLFASALLSLAQAQTKPSADLIVTNAKIWTVEKPGLTLKRWPCWASALSPWAAQRKWILARPADQSAGRARQTAASRLQ